MRALATTAEDDLTLAFAKSHNYRFVKSCALVLTSQVEWHSCGSHS
jgi:hypothetical protein